MRTAALLVKQRAFKLNNSFNMPDIVRRHKDPWADINILRVCSPRCLSVIHAALSHSWIKQYESIFSPHHMCIWDLGTFMGTPGVQHQPPTPFIPPPVSWRTRNCSTMCGKEGGQLWTRAAVGHTSHAAVTKWTLYTCNTIPTNDLIQSEPVKVKADTISFKKIWQPGWRDSLYSPWGKVPTASAGEITGYFSWILKQTLCMKRWKWYGSRPTVPL